MTPKTEAEAEPRTITHMVRNLEPKMWAQVKARAALDQVSLQGLIVWLMTLYAKRGLTAFEAIDGKFPR